MNWLKLLGFDTKKPLQSLLQLFNLFGRNLIQDELNSYFEKRVTAGRQKDLVDSFRRAADDLDAKNSYAAASEIVKVLRTIKF
jgi:hypothetical protein